MMLLTPHDFLAELRARGADGVRRVVFRRTRSTIFSLTRYGRVLNLNAAFAAAPPELLDAFAVVARTGARRTRAYDRAVHTIRNWPPLAAALEEARARHQANGGGRATRSAPCCGTPEQRAYLRDLYARLNQACFGGRLPPDIPLRLSNRMRRRLGQIRYDDAGAERTVLEIALNVDLMLRANDAHRLETLLHEMAHAEAYLLYGERGHGARWRQIARRVGCEPRAFSDVRIARRRRRADPVTRVPPPERWLPDGTPLPEPAPGPRAAAPPAASVVTGLSEPGPTEAGAPGAAPPEAGFPEADCPRAIGPAPAGPAAADPLAVEPAAAGPVAVEPAVAGPAAADPVADPAMADPAADAVAVDRAAVDGAAIERAAQPQLDLFAVGCPESSRRPLVQR